MEIDDSWKMGIDDSGKEMHWESTRFTRTRVFREMGIIVTTEIISLLMEIDFLPRDQEILVDNLLPLQGKSLLVRRKNRNQLRSGPSRRFPEREHMPDQASKSSHVSSISEQMSMCSSEIQEKLVQYFNFLLHEMKRVGYMMKHMASIKRETGIPISVDKIVDLLQSTSRLTQISCRVVEMMKEITKSVEETYADHRAGWENTWGNKSGLRIGFEDLTTLSPMHFTYRQPGLIPRGYTSICASTLQIYSLEITELKGNLKWPLYVYGVVAARDTVDHKRNLLFCRSRANCQEVTENAKFLHLIGPSRAILALDYVHFEFELKMKDGKSDRDLITRAYRYHGRHHTCNISNWNCALELSLDRLLETVQATILSVRVGEGESWPFEYGVRVACYSQSLEVVEVDSEGVVGEVTGPKSGQVDLLHCCDKPVPLGPDGYLHLSRQVVSVEQQDCLKVVIEAYSSPKLDIAARGHIYFPQEYCNISHGTCLLGQLKVEISVAWSYLAADKLHLLKEEYA
ncbi:uncharacterized protein LOC100832293 [Brachypodium distachyon]|uniref:DUF6598 domain-containing protein n=1 Tax=Brachypodium distachyon TaxID=15368 RepID=I1IZ30_BRADI|nr:uncharacterized protein LOC100832293 [Brachypodium distachyon]KQJ83271.1 hypothetical protein BRADI_5g14030v3 [Brachypodium distachyon]|eukprot:XP_003580020.2 uncharacterized protein LOC100832293 [Brachypodium distachyon]